MLPTSRVPAYRNSIKDASGETSVGGQSQVIPGMAGTVTSKEPLRKGRPAMAPDKRNRHLQEYVFRLQGKQQKYLFNLTFEARVKHLGRILVSKGLVAQ